MIDNHESNTFEQALAAFEDHGITDVANWSVLDIEFAQLKRTYGQARETDLEASYKRIRIGRQAIYETELAELKQTLDQRKPITRADFRDRSIRLGHLLHDIDERRFNPARSLKDLDTQLGQNELLSGIRVRVNQSIQVYNEAINQGIDPFEAARRFLEPLLNEIKIEIDQKGNTAENTLALMEVESLIKQADKSDEATIVQQGTYELVIENLKKQPSNAPVTVLGRDGRAMGRPVPRDTAIGLYEDEARKYALGKKDQYMENARNSLAQGDIGIADIRVQQILRLFRLPDVEKSNILQFRDKEIAPLLSRVSHARDLLQSISFNHPPLDEALRSYDEALSPMLGWPRFAGLSDQVAEVMAVQEGGVSGQIFASVNPGESGRLVTDARSYILTLMRTELQTRLSQLADLTRRDKVVKVTTPEDLKRLESYLNWDSQLRIDFDAKLSDLRTAVDERMRLRTALNQAVLKARRNADNGGYQAAYDELRQFKPLIENERTMFADAATLLDQVEAYVNQLDIQCEVRRWLDIGNYRLATLSEDIEAVKLLLNNAYNVPDNVARGIGLNTERQYLGHFLALLQGTHAREQHNAQGLQILKDQIPDNSPFKAKADQLAREIEQQLRTDTNMDSAIDRARLLKDTSPEQAYRQLAPFIGKTDVRNYTVFLKVYEEVCHAYGQSLIEAIHDVIDRTNNASERIRVSPAQFLDFGKQLQAVAPQQYALWEQRILATHLLLDARYKEHEAAETRNLQKWKDAIDAWRRLDRAVYREDINRVFTGYMDVLVESTLWEINKSDQTDHQARLDETLSVIRQFEDEVPGVPDVAFWRAAVYTVFAENDDLYLITIHLNEARQQLERISPADVPPALLERIDSLTTLSRAAGQMVIILEKTATLDVFKRSVDEWNVALRPFTLTVGLNRSLQAKISGYLEKVTDGFALTQLTWAQLPGLARRKMLQPETQIPNLRSVFRALTSDINSVVEDYTGRFVLGSPNDSTEIDNQLVVVQEQVYLQSLIEALQAHTWLDIGQTAPMPGSASDPLLAKLNAKREQLQEIGRAVTDARDLLYQRACPTGAFHLVDARLQQLPGQYALHPDITAIETERAEHQAEYIRLDAIREQVEQQFAIEDFINLTAALDQLEASDKRYKSARTPKVIDAYAGMESLKNIAVIRQRVEEKSRQIEAMIQALTRLIDRENLLAIIRPDPTQVPNPGAITLDTINIARTHIVNYESILITIVDCRNRADYPGAIATLYRVWFGRTVIDNDPSEKYDGATFSLDAAYNEITANWVWPDPGQIKSGTAEAIFIWVDRLAEKLMFWLEQITKGIKPWIEQSQGAYDKRLTEINDIGDRLDRRARNRQRDLDLLQKAFRSIRGEKGFTYDFARQLLDINPTEADYEKIRALLEPLAPANEDYDTFYLQYFKELP